MRPAGGCLYLHVPTLEEYIVCRARKQLILSLACLQAISTRSGVSSIDSGTCPMKDRRLLALDVTCLKKKLIVSIMLGVVLPIAGDMGLAGMHGLGSRG